MSDDPVADAGRICLDSNALIYLLDRVHPYFPWLHRLFESIAGGERVAVVSVISEMEVMVKPLRDEDFDGLNRLDDALSHPSVVVVALDRSIARRAAEIRAALDLSIPDAVVAATAVEAGCDLIVGNDKQFAQRMREIPYIYLDDVVSR
ncbi:MAG TPA: PIN domain-containing protein [Dehalococcoidia bacterium]|nr:PIN domain-containing protein [Dehalococcoidia bacterium]